jgi:hypothetical protein
LYERNLFKLLESKNVELTEVEEAADVRVFALRKAYPLEFNSFESLTKREFIWAYFEVRGEGL